MFYQAKIAFTTSPCTSVSQAPEAVGEFGVIAAHQMQNRGVQVVDMNLVFQSMPTSSVAP